ncbi:hypothetical protein J2Z65_006405 [Paenibacillus aceris]|uniref:Uncharacterized protein n=1 Tax=Paenibacillus aceris TaxID=869555 RepID=A0ABS4I880_9BACL|nr:hypothetical protein [Paenibacillus aceris]
MISSPFLFYHPFTENEVKLPQTKTLKSRTTTGRKAVFQIGWFFTLYIYHHVAIKEFRFLPALNLSKCSCLTLS